MPYTDINSKFCGEIVYTLSLVTNGNPTIVLDKPLAKDIDVFNMITFTPVAI
jgi:hypothetical protein